MSTTTEVKVPTVMDIPTEVPAGMEIRTVPSIIAWLMDMSSDLTDDDKKDWATKGPHNWWMNFRIAKTPEWNEQLTAEEKAAFKGVKKLLPVRRRKRSRSNLGRVGSPSSVTDSSCGGVEPAKPVSRESKKTVHFDADESTDDDDMSNTVSVAKKARTEISIPAEPASELNEKYKELLWKYNQLVDDYNKLAQTLLVKNHI